jgi:Bacterial protein of unknown function (DUF937)
MVVGTLRRTQALGQGSAAPGTGNKSVRIKTVLSEAQNGQAYANLARAFHLDPEKVEEAVNDMLDALVFDLGERMAARRSLADIVELLGRSDYEHVLETPVLLGATHTQVLGTEALNVIAGRKESKRLVRHAAMAAGVSEMIAEYLLPAVAALLVGALAKVCRPELEAIMGHSNNELAAALQSEPTTSSPQLPHVSGGVGFTGSTGGITRLANYGALQSHYVDLAAGIRRPAAGVPDVAEAVRRVLAPILGLPLGTLGWIRRITSWSTGALNAALAGRRR